MGLFSKIGARLDMMQEMFKQTGAVNASVQGFDSVPSLREAIHRCANCADADTCRKWLDLGIEENLVNRAVPEFCANSSFQNQLKARQ